MARKKQETIQQGMISFIDFSNAGEKKGVIFDFGDPKLEMEAYRQHMARLSGTDAPKPAESVQVIKLSKAIEMYMEWKGKQRNQNGARGLSKKVELARMTNFEIMRQVLGDINICDVTKPKIRAVLEVIDNMPRRNKSPYHKWSLSECIDAATNKSVEDSDLVASNQAGEALKDYQSLFSRYLTDEVDLLKEAPTKGIKVDVESLSYSSFSTVQISEIVRYWEKQEDSDYKWNILLGAYTGARRGEIFELDASSIQFDSSSNRYYLFIKEGKSKAARRKVPLHARLIELGFLEYVEKVTKISDAQPVNRVFTSFKTDHCITTKFRASLDELGIPKLNDENRRFSFHSLRHTVVTKALGENCELHLVQQVIGHEHAHAGITEKYAGEFELKSVLRVIDCLDW